MENKKQLLEAHYRKDYSKLVKTTSYRLGNDRALAEDVVQEAYSVALRYLKSFNPQYDFGGWFDRILTNTLIRTKRLEQDKGVVKDNDYPIPHEGDNYLAKRQLRELIQLEKPRNHDLLHMFFFEGFNARQISDFLGIKHDSVRQIVNRFRDKVVAANGVE